MKRRGFLGLFAATTVAGPKVAANVIKEIPHGLPIDHGFMSLSIGGETDQGMTTATLTRKPWRLVQVAKLKAFLSGQLTPEQKQEIIRAKLFHRQTVVSQGIAQLHSVSAIHKVAMCNRQMMKINVAIQKAHARGMIGRLLEEHSEQENG